MQIAHDEDDEEEEEEEDEVVEEVFLFLPRPRVLMVSTVPLVILIF